MLSRKRLLFSFLVLVALVAVDYSMVNGSSEEVCVHSARRQEGRISPFLVDRTNYLLNFL